MEFEFDENVKALTPDERALIEHIRKIRSTLANGELGTLGEQIGVVVVTFTQKHMFWRIASALETSDESMEKLKE